MKITKMRRSIWGSGRKYLCSLPVEWARTIKEQYGGKIDEVQIGDKIVITPPFDPARKSVVRVTPNLSNIAELKMKVVTAYLEGYDIVEIPIDSPLSEDLRAKICSFVPHTIGEPSLDNTFYKLTFIDDHSLSIKKSFDDTKSIFRELRRRVVGAFTSFPDLENIQRNMEYAHNQEHKLDDMSFIIKRNLNRALLSVGLYEQLGVSNDRDAIHLSLIFEHYERLGDIHIEIIERMVKMLKRKTESNTLNIDIPKLDSFRSYYDDAYKTIEISLDALDDARTGLKLIEGKLSGWEKYENFAYHKRNIMDFIYKQTEPALIRDLTILEDKIAAIPYISSNICELAWNKDRAALSSPPSS